MPLNSLQKEMLTRHLEKHGPDYKCPFCSTVNDWRFGELVVVPALSTDLSPKAPIQQQVILIQIFCRHCFFLMQFNAVAIGLSPDDPAAN
jgi:hypothetical protein